MLSQTDYAISPQTADGEIERCCSNAGRIRRQFVHWMLDPEIVHVSLPQVSICGWPCGVW